MGVTTFESVRNSQLTTVEGITPSLATHVRFLRHKAEQDFTDWCLENAQACFRRFSVVDLFDYTAPTISNTDIEFVEGREQVVIAYPEDYRYGMDNFRDLRDLIRSDQYLVDNSLGHRGTGNYTDAHAVLENVSLEDEEAVSFLTLTFIFRFYRSV